MSEIRQRQRSTDVVQSSKNDNDNEPETDFIYPLFHESPYFKPLRTLSNVIFICSLTLVILYSNEQFRTFAKQSVVLPGKGLVIDCCPKYLKEINQYPGCFPRECKRYVTDHIVSASEVSQLLEIAKKGLKLGGSSGGASILDLHSGALSMGQHFVNFYKIDQGKNIFNENDFNVYRVVKEKIKHAVAHHFGVNPDKIYLTHPTFFSQITSKDAVTVHDEYWHPHVDKETYKSFHYTTLLYLSNYKADFEGGRFVFFDKNVNSTVEPRKGRVSMFTSGRENLHFIEKVKSGKRYAVTISFTCDEKYAIEDPSVSKYQDK